MGKINERSAKDILKFAKSIRRCEQLNATDHTLLFEALINEVEDLKKKVHTLETKGAVRS